MKNVSAVFIMLVLLGFSNAYGVTQTYQEGDLGPFSQMDAVELEEEHQVGLNNTKMSVWGKTWENKYALIKFEDVFGSSAGQIEYGSTIASATLDLKTEWVDSGPSLDVFMLQLDFDENTIDWETYIFPQSVATAGVHYYAPVITSFTPTVGETVYTIDITTAVQEWADQTKDNFGLIIKSDSTASNNFARFYSDNATNLADRPLLTITTSEAAIPEPTTMILLGSAIIGLVRRAKSRK